MRVTDLARAALLLLSLVAASTGCTSTQHTTQVGEVKGWVRDIQLDNLRGEVGRPFQSRLTFRTDYIDDPEFHAADLPPGLRFDSDSRSIVGTPKRAGFYRVQVSLRKRVPKEAGRRPKPDERWWPADFEIEIYKPMVD
jgi:hypothetical protein